MSNFQRRSISEKVTPSRKAGLLKVGLAAILACTSFLHGGERVLIESLRVQGADARAWRLMKNTGEYKALNLLLSRNKPPTSKNCVHSEFLSAQA